MTNRRGHELVDRAPAHCAVVAVGSKGGEASTEKDGNAPLGNGGRLRPPLFFGHANA
jgi:hypothetical protein